MFRQEVMAAGGVKMYYTRCKKALFRGMEGISFSVGDTLWGVVIGESLPGNLMDLKKEGGKKRRKEKIIELCGKLYMKIFWGVGRRVSPEAHLPKNKPPEEQPLGEHLRKSTPRRISGQYLDDQSD